jgi:hypothetical protein
MKLHYLLLSLLITTFCNAVPRVEFIEEENDTLKIVYFNDTGEALRYLVIPEGLKKSNETNITESSRWAIERKDPMSDGYSSAGAKGRTEEIATHTIPNISQVIPQSYDRKRIAVILEWNEGGFESWQNSKATVTYYEIK